MEGLEEMLTSLMDGLVFQAWALLQHKYANTLSMKCAVNYTKYSSDLLVIYESSNYIVVNKNYDVLINSNDPSKVTVQRQLKEKFPHLANSKLGHEYMFCHRLDYPTSGLLCIACNKEAAASAMQCFAARKTFKFYVTIVRGVVSCELLDIIVPIGDDKRKDFSGIKMAPGDSIHCINSKHAHTRLLILQHGLYDGEYMHSVYLFITSPIIVGYPATKLLLKPITGRRHQLRVHLHYIGHTIVGDFTYSNRKDILPSRMCLHSIRLILPSSVEYIDIKTSDPFQETEFRKWVPVKTLNKIDNYSYERLNLDEVKVI